MAPTPTTALSRSSSFYTINLNPEASVSVSQAANAPSLVPSKRSEDDIQFISSQPVKKQKLSQTKLRIKVTPPRPSQPNQQVHSHQQVEPRYQRQSRTPPIVVPDIQLTPPTQETNYEQTKSAELAQDRRVSTGMVTLPPSSHELDTMSATRGISLPVTTCFDNFVLDQPTDRLRPISSPPLSPKQLPYPAPISMRNANTSSTNIPWSQDVCSPITVMSEPRGHGGQLPTALPIPAQCANVAVTAAGPLTPISSPSPAGIISRERSIPSMPPQTPVLAKHHCRQSPDKAQQTVSTHISLQQNPILPLPLHHHAGPRPPCLACAAQKAMMTRPQDLPMPIMGVTQMSHLPMQSYPHSPRQFMATPVLHPEIHPMMMPVHFDGHGSTIPRHGHVSLHHQQPSASTAQPSMPMLMTPPPPMSTVAGHVGQVSLLAPTPQPTALVSPTEMLSTMASTHQKPAKHLIVDIAKTCQEKFPFHEVAERQNVPLKEVIDVYTAMIEIPLLRYMNDLGIPGKLATIRVKEYEESKKYIREERVGNQIGAVQGVVNELKSDLRILRKN